MKNVMFQEAPIPTPDRGAFDLSHEKKLSCQIGELIPLTWWEYVPGDQFRISTELLVKWSPLLRPMLHRVDAYVHAFKVPYRLLMNPYATTQGGWKQFITGTWDDDGFVACQLPYVTISDANKAYFSEGTLADYLGLPVIDSGTTVTQDVDVNVFPFTAYHKIFDDFYRDENLMDRVCWETGNAPAGSIDLVGGNMNADIALICNTILRNRSYEKDYFRGALPQAYFGAEADVTLEIPTVGNPAMYGSGFRIETTLGGIPAAGDTKFDGATRALKDFAGSSLEFGDGYKQPLSADLEMLELLRAQAILKYLTAENRGGKRYNEMLLGVFGVTPQNAELDYPEYIGGGKVPVQVTSIENVSQVLDPTAGVNDGVGGAVVTVDPQSYEAGKGQASGRTNTYSTYCNEHGIIMLILSVLPRTAYGGAQIEKFWRKTDREEFFVPQLQGIGDQAILQSEIGYDATGTDMDDEFGYQVPWAEYKFKNSTVHGSFLSTVADWHMAHIGDTSGAGPSLNTAFVNCGPALTENTRIFASSGAEDKLYVEAYNSVRAIRPMKVFDVVK